MAYFTESATLEMLDILNEKKSTEEYHRNSFKKKYNFVPDKPGSSTGTITKDGKKYKIDMGKSKIVDIGGYDVARSTIADTSDKDSKVVLDKNYFKLKGSNHSERRDAMLNHELGHQNLHNMNPENKTVDKKNRTPDVHKKIVSSMGKDQSGIDLSSDKSLKKNDLDPHSSRKAAYDANGAKEYAASSTRDKDEVKKRNDSLKAASKYEKDSPHANAIEYEADRFAANRTSEGAVKRGVNQGYKFQRQDTDKAFKKLSGSPYMTKDDIDAIDATKALKNKLAQTDKNQRAKALKDEDMRKSDTYK